MTSVHVHVTQGNDKLFEVNKSALSFVILGNSALLGMRAYLAVTFGEERVS